MKRVRMDEDQLRNLIEQHERQAIGYYTGEVASEQAKAIDYYLSKPMGTEEEGRSQVISSDVRDVVEGLTPIVLKPFVASDDVVRFNPLGPDDEQAAQQETDYINWVVTQKNDVFNELMAWVKTGLLQKNGVVKYWWEKSRKASIERYFGISDDEYALLIQDDDVEIIEHSEVDGDQQMGPDGQMAQEQPTHDVTVRTVEEVGEAKYTVIPPEEFLIGKSTSSPNPQTARFVQHRRKVTISELREMGYDVEDDLSDGGEDLTFSLQYQARRSQEENAHLDEALDPASREVMYRETILMVDFDGDGMAELRKVCMVGENVLLNEETEEINFAAWTPSQQPFKFYGRCPADDAIEFQDIKTTLLRQNLDNIYTVNNNRVYVSAKVNMDDLVDNQIAGLVRVDGDDVGRHVQAAEITPLGAIILPQIEYLDSAKENRIGLTRYNQGTDADSLNKTATGVRIIKEAGDSRTELISRSFAEQGLAPLMIGIHGLCRRHATKAETVQLRGEWVTVDPRQWKKRSNMSVSVGLGTADQQMKMQGAQLLFNTQMQLAQSPYAGMIQPANVYATTSKLVTALGYKQPEQFVTPPDKVPPQQPPPPNPEIELKHRELDIREGELRIKEHDSLVLADKTDADIALSASQAGFDARIQVLEALNKVSAGDQAQQAQDHAQGLAEGNQAMAAQAQDHSQGLAEQGQALQAQGQAHSQDMAEQAAEQAAQEPSGDAL